MSALHVFVHILFSTESSQNAAPLLSYDHAAQLTKQHSCYNELLGSLEKFAETRQPRKIRRERQKNITRIFFSGARKRTKTLTTFFVTV
jgi:hypothetical protein